MSQESADRIRSEVRRILKNEMRRVPFFVNEDDVRQQIIDILDDFTEHVTESDLRSIDADRLIRIIRSELYSR